MSDRGKITETHRRRRAVVYVRQSTLAQVERNVESTARQYALRERAVELGWPPGSVVVVDEDLGRSGASSDGRFGFKELVAEVGLGHVGLILALETSRLARSSADWHQLLDLCALTQTLIADADGVSGGAPLRLCPLDGEVDQLGRGLLVGEMPAGLDRLADLAVHRLDRVGRVDDLAQVLGQRQKRDDVLPAGPPTVGDHRVAGAPFLVEALELCERGFGVGGAVDRPQVLGQRPAVLVADVAHRGSDLVNDAGLHPGLGEDGLDRVREPGEAVDAGDQDVLDAALVEVVEDGQPELRALVVLPPDPQGFAVAVASDSDGQIASAGADGAVFFSRGVSGVHGCAWKA